MAKAKRTKAKATKVSTPAAPPMILSDTGGRSDIDARQLESVSGASRGEVGWKSDSEPRLESAAEAANENAALVGQAWQERNRREGIPYFACPMCPGAEVQFKGKTAKKDCQAHINKTHKMRVKELKLVKASKDMYMPKAKIESPKRTLADAVHPKYREQVEASIRARDALRPLSEHAHRLSTSSSNAIMKLVSMTESLAIQQIPKLNNEELVAVYQVAERRGKRLLARAARRACDTKGLILNGVPVQSEKQKSIQEALLNASFKAAAIVR